ncbi:obscurin isoform X2 [Nymphalis io]|uniref:obscurin isoform X2 n=1 Tax=Inachis io TaxID=171585 RepID=UPI0021687A1F|nr:obscurin isoform X2 [Nymphalis io]
MSFCRITGRSRGLPKPNYFPLLAPISPADAKRCCRITGKSYGLPSHHYIPVLLTANSAKTKCKITNVSGELGPHHYSPEINYGNRKHEILPDYRYIFPILDGSTEAQRALMEMLLTKQVADDKRYVYTVQERRCSLVFSARMEAAVRDGDVRDVMLAKDSDTVLIKTKQGRSVSMDFKDFTEEVEIFEGEGPNAEVLKQRELEELEERKKKRKRAAGLSSMKKIFENKEKLAEVQELEEEKLRQDRLAKKAKMEEVKHEKHDIKSFSCNNFDLNHMRSKSSIVRCSGDWKDQIHPLIENWDWDLFEKDIKNESFTPKVTSLPSPIKITPYHCETEIYEVDRNICDVSITLESVPCVNPLKPIKSRPSEEVLSAVTTLPEERLVETSNVTEKLLECNKIDMLPTVENLPDIVKNIKKGKREKVGKISGLTLDIDKAKKFIPGQHITTPQGIIFIPGQTVETPAGPLFVPGLSVNTPAGPGLIPGHFINNETTNEPFFLVGQVLQTTNGEEFVCGQTVKNKDDSYRFIEGQTVLSEEGFKFVPGKSINNGLEDVFVPGQTIMTPDGVQFIPGQTIVEKGNIIFTPGQNAKINNEWQFVPGQVVHQDDELLFIPGATLATPNGLKFVPGQTVTTNGETLFVPGITKMGENDLEFIPGTTVDTIDGPKFVEGQIVTSGHSEKFLPGKTIVQSNGHVDFSVAKSIEDITFTESTPTGLPIDIKTCSLSEESLYVFGHMVQTSNGIEFYPGPRIPKLDGKVVPGRLVKNEANQSRFVPGMMVEGIFVPGQIVFTENGEQFVPGQVVDTVDGPKFVPGQVVNTKSGPKFVPGQTIHTIDGPRFVPGQIIDTKAGPTFIPGQVISTEDEGSRFVPGQVVDTDEGPRFVPGRVIETDDQGVTFVPGQIVQTPEGLKFVAPDLIEGEEGLEFSVQSFVVTPEELKLLKVKTNPNDTTSTKGELTIDTKMLRQLSEAGMSIGRQVPTDLPAINIILNQTKNAETLKAFVTDFGLKDEVANQLMDVISSIIEMSVHLKSEINVNHKDNGLIVDGKKSRANKKRMDVINRIDNGEDQEENTRQEKVKNSIAAAVLAALVTAEQYEEINNNNGKEKYHHILKSIDTILGKAIDEDFVSAMFKILQREEDKEILSEAIVENSTNPKMELIKLAINNALDKNSLTEEQMIDKFSEFLSQENEVIGPAFKNITKNDPMLLHQIMNNISDSISFVKTDYDATEALQKMIVAAIQESSNKTLENVIDGSNKELLKETIIQSAGLARVLGLSDVAKKLLSVIDNEKAISKIESDDVSMNILRRLTVMKKLAEQNPSLHSAIRKLETDAELARTDPKLRDLVRESAALMIVPEEPPLLTSEDVPLSLLQPENSLAMEDFLFQRKKHPGALLIMKKGLQAVVPREASRAVLTGQVAYTVLDENGIRHFEPLHVFSALNLSQPTAHRFSMYSCPVLDDNDEDLQSFTGYCNISQNQRITKYGGWNKKYSGVLLDRENTRSRMNSVKNTPSYERYHSRSLTRSRSTCSRSPSKVDDVVVATADYTAAGDDEVSLKAGDIVEVLDTKTALGSKWLVRVVEDVQGGELCTRQGYVPAHVLKEKVPERDQTALAARRQAVVRELIETEEEFGRDMQQVVSRYMRPMDKATTPKIVFDNRELLFSNFKQICEFHNTSLLEGIKYYAGEPRMLGRSLLRMEREFDKHVAYCRDEPLAQHLLKNDPVVSKYFKALADKLGDDKGLTEHLKLPIQRINDYQLLLKELVKYSKRLGDDCTDLQKALELFLGVPNRATNNIFIDSIEGYRGNIYKLGRLLTHDWFTVDYDGEPKNHYVFLFKARILICEVQRVEEDRSVFVLKHIVKLPEVEIKDHPESTKFELHQKDPHLVFNFKAHKESVKTAWLREIRQYASDLVALAEHAADDLQILPQEIIEQQQPEEKRKRESEDQPEERQEKKSRVEELEVTDLSSKEESQQVIKTKRKASSEGEHTSKISKAEATEVSSITEVQEVQSSSVSTVESRVTTNLESSSLITEVSEKESVTSQSQVVQQKLIQANENIISQEETAALSIETAHKQFEQSVNGTGETIADSVVNTEFNTKAQGKVSSKSLSEQTASATFESSLIERKSKEELIVESKVAETKDKESVSYSRQVTEAILLSEAQEVGSSVNQNELGDTREILQSKSTNADVKSSESSRTDIVQTVKEENAVITDLEYEKTKSKSAKKQLVVEEKAEEILNKNTNTAEETSGKTQQETVSFNRQTSKVLVEQSQTTEETGLKNNKIEESETKSAYQSTLESNVLLLSQQSFVDKKKQEDKENVQPSKEESTLASNESNNNKTSVTDTTEKSVEKSKVEVIQNGKTATNHKSIKSKKLESEQVTEIDQTAEGSVSQNVEESKQTVTSGASGERASTEVQAVTTEEADGDMSRYSRSSRLSGEYSSSSRKLSTGGRYESSSYDSTGASSYRRESGSRLESSRYEAGVASEGSASSRFESKYSTSSKTEGGSKYGIETSYDDKDGSKYAIESESKLDSIASKYGLGSNTESQVEGRTSKYSIESGYDGSSTDTTSKIDSIASKYGLGTNSELQIEGRSSKYSVEASYDGNSADTTSKIDSIASKYGRNSITDSAKIESRSTKLNIETSYDGDINGDSKIESSYTKIKNGDTASQKKYSKTKISNGSVTEERGSTKLISKTESSDGKPIFVKTIEGQNIEPGENAIFECALQDSEAKVTWLKDNKPFSDRLMDRVVMEESEGRYRLEVLHCREDDSGVYTARAENVNGNAHCTAQLVVHELTPEERKQRNALNAPYFIVALKDTEIMMNTYLRFMVKVKGNPNPEVKFYRDGKEIVTSSTEERVNIVRTRAERGCYELVIADVLAQDAGRYSCRALNEYGDVTSEALVTVVDDKNIFGELPPGGEGLLAKGEKATFTWKKDGVDFDPEERFKVLLEDDEDSLALVFQHVKPEDAGLYTCVAKTSTGNISCSAELTVQGAVNFLHREPQKPQLVIEHREAIVSSGGSAMLELVCKGYPKPTVVFKHDGKVVEADTRHKFLHEDDESMSLVIKNVTSADAGEYHVTASNDLGEDTTIMNLVVKAPPKIKKKIENQTCMAGSTHEVIIEVEGSPSPDVSFYKDGVEIKSSERITIVKESEEIYKIIIKDTKLTDTGSYSVVAKNEVNQCSDFWQWHVTSPPKILQMLGGERSCGENDSVTFEVRAEGDPAPTVTWYKNKTELKESSAIKITSSGEAHKLVITSAARADSGEYSCEIRNVHGSAADACALHVRRAPRFTRRLRDASAAEGDVDVEFTVDVDAYPQPNVKWYLGDVEITEKKSVYTRLDNGSTHKLILKEVTAEMSGQYTCKVSNELGEDSCQATFTVNRKPRITKSLVDMTVDVGQTLKLEVEVEGCPEPKIKWYKDGKEVTTDARIKIERDTQRLENYFLTVTLVKEEDGGEYEVRADNEMGSVACKSTVTVHTKEVHSRFKKESLVENEIEDDSKVKKQQIDDMEDTKKTAKKDKTKPEKVEEKSLVDEIDATSKTVTIEQVEQSSPDKATKVRTEPEEIEEKSFWDDVNDDGKAKSVKKDDVKATPKKAKTAPEEIEEKSFWDNVNDDGKIKSAKIDDVESAPKKVKREPEEIEEKSFWDDAGDDGKTKSVKLDDVETTPKKAKKSITEPETAEIKVWDENHNEQIKKPVVEEAKAETQKGDKDTTKPEVIEEVTIADELKSAKRKSIKKQSVSEEPLSAESEGRVFETVTTFKSGDDGSIIVSKVSSTRSHGAIITGPAEMRTLHKMTSSAVYYDEDDECDRKIVKPNTPHTTSLEVEEIASHSYYMSEIGHYTIPDHIRRGTYGIIEEPQTDSDVETNSRYGRPLGNRTVSIMSMSEDEMSWHNDSLSREISIEDLSKSIFDIDETRKVFSKDSYVRQSSFKEDYFTDQGDEETIILNEKSHKIFENDITEKLIQISKEFDENEFKQVENKINDVKNRIIEELVLGPSKNVDNITKDVAETTVERRKKTSTGLFIVEEEADGDIAELLRRSQRQRSILDDIINKEDEKAPPKLKESSMKDGHTYESLPMVYTVEASGTPKPTIRWLHDGQEVKPNGRVHISNIGDLYKLEIDTVDLKDAGNWQCEVINDLGKQTLQAELTVSPVADLRKPIFTAPLEAQRVMQREPVTLKAVCTADPLPHVAWLLNGKELTPDATLVVNEESKELDHGIKECTFTLHIPTGRHTDTGIYTVQAKNKYGIGESSARLDILLRPEVEPLKDITIVPFEETTFITKIRANPVAEVKWSKDGYVIQPSTRHEIIEDREAETFKLVIKNVGLEDAGQYTVTATNEIGETTQQARLNVHTDKPTFVRPIQKQIVKDYDDCTLRVRCDGVPKPQVKWFLNGKEVVNDDRHTVTTEVGGQVDSELEIKHFGASDAGKYTVRAMSVSGEAECEAMITLAQIPPGFSHKLDRQKDVDEGEPLELKAKVDGSPIPTAKWFKDGAELSPDDSHIKQTVLPDGTVKLSIEHVTPSDCGAYKLVINNPSGEHMAICAVAVNPTPRKPSFSQELEDVKVVVGQPVQLQARVMAFPAPEVKWFKDGVPVRPSQAVNFINQPGGVVGLSIDSCRPEDAGVYSLIVTNKLGEVASKAKVEVGQKERKPAFIAELQPAKVIEGFPVKLEVKVIGHPPPTIKWTHNGKEVVPDGQRVRAVSQADGSHALLLSAAGAGDAGRYAALATNDRGQSACEADLTVAGREDASVPQERPQFIHGLREVTGEEGKPLNISAPFTGNPVPQVTWTKDGQPLKPNEKIFLNCDGKKVGLEISSLELPDAGVYSVKLVNPLGEDTTEGKINVRKVFQPPRFTQKFTDLQQLPTFDAKFPARVIGIPAPEITWYKNGNPLKASEKYSIKRDGDACCLYVRDITQDDAGQYKCVAKNKEGEDSCEAALEVVDKIGRKQKVEPPTFLKKIGDAEVIRGLSAKFTACATGTPEPEVEWFRNDDKLFPSERIRIEQETTGLLRLTIGGVGPEDVATYRCRIYNPHGEDSCTAQLIYDTLEPQSGKKPMSEQYSDFDKMKKTGVPMPLTDKPIISRMADRHLTLSWKPSIPHQPRFPVTYQVEMCEVPDGDWFTARTGLRSCVCDIRNLEPFRDYKFRVRVENKYGVSDPSPYASTHRAKLEPDPPKFVPYLEPGIDFRPETSPYFPRDFDIERPPHDGYAQAPKFLRQEYDSQYGVKGHNVNLFWFVYGYPKPKMTYFFNDEPIEIGGRYDWSYTRNGQATLFINKMLERDVGWYEAVASNEHGQARQRVRLQLAEYPAFVRRPEEAVVLQRRLARIEARVAGVPFPDIKWYKDWQPLAQSSRVKMHFIEPDTVVLTISDVMLKDEGLYSVSARNVAGAVSASAMLYVEESEHDYSARIREYPPRIKASSKPFGDYYDLGDEIGRGVQGVVYHAAERTSGRNYAAKIMHGHSDLKPFMKNELDIMNILNDRHLVRLYDAYEHDHTLALVTELAAGGELVRDRLLRSQGYTEREVAGYVRQLLRGLKHMHDNSVAHLGLTIGELLLSHAGSDLLKICDFGLSRRIQMNKYASLDYGMPEFVSPEVASGEGVSFAADMWSVGVITYVLLSGHSPFRGADDRETLGNVRAGAWAWHDEAWWARFSAESRDFISRLLQLRGHDRLDVDAALAHPWLQRADRIYEDEYVIATDRLRNYYNLYRDWTSNAQCRTWFRRRPLSGAFDHPSKMVYPPGEIYTPEATPDRDSVSHERKPGDWDIKFKQWEHPDWEVSAKSESHYQNGPDTYLLQLRDTQFPVRLREYMKVACHRSPGYSLSIQDSYDPRTPIIRERRRFTDIMDEEIDDERRERINNYGSESYTIRRLRHELGTRLDSYAEAQAFMESKKDGQLPFFREKPQVLPVQEGEQTQLSCYAVGDPKPVIQWFKNDMVIAEGQRIKIIEDEEGRSTLKFDPAMHHDIGFYKVVARNKVGQTVARTRIVEATNPDAPDSPTATDVSDKEVLLRWKQPKYDGNSPVVCYSLQYKKGDSVEWNTVAENIDHEFFVVRDLEPDTSYQFRLSSRNRIGWSDKGIPTNLIKTKAAGTPKIEVTKAMRHLQQITESGQEIVLYEDRPKLDYATEENPIDWDATQNFSERYSFISELWRGKFSIVVKGVDKTTDSVVVAKILEVRPETEVQVQREFNCLRKLRHERISNLLGAYQIPGSPVAALILEKLQGADVLTYLSSRHDYSEQMVATIITQALDGLQYLHWRGYCHLDLQPDNVVMASVRSIQVKLIDFGSAHRVTKLGTSVPQVGELEYKAPEIINDEAAYPQTDIWSLGVLAYILLSGVSPFRGSDDAETKQNISFVRYRFEHLYKEITQEATRFLMLVFKKVPLKRPTAEECYEHRWLAHSDFTQRKRERAVFISSRLKEFSDEYHERKSREASQADTLASFGSPRILTRSNSITDELLTTFSSR